MFTQDSVQRLRKEEITGIEFLKKYCDGKLVSDMLKDEIIPFVTSFYNKNYLKQYAHWVMTVLHDIPLEFRWDWTDYRKYEKYLSNKYRNHIQSEKLYNDYIKSKEKQNNL